MYFFTEKGLVKIICLHRKWKNEKIKSIAHFQNCRPALFPMLTRWPGQLPLFTRPWWFNRCAKVHQCASSVTIYYILISTKHTKTTFFSLFFPHLFSTHRQPCFAVPLPHDQISLFVCMLRKDCRWFAFLFNDYDSNHFYFVKIVTCSWMSEIFFIVSFMHKYLNL